MKPKRSRITRYYSGPKKCPGAVRNEACGPHRAVTMEVSFDEPEKTFDFGEVESSWPMRNGAATGKDAIFGGRGDERWLVRGHKSYRNVCRGGKRVGGSIRYREEGFEGSNFAKGTFFGDLQAGDRGLRAEERHQRFGSSIIRIGCIARSLEASSVVD